MAKVKKLSKINFRNPLDLFKCRENFCGFCFISIGSKPLLKRFTQKIFVENLQKTKLFSRLTFIVYGNMTKLLVNNLFATKVMHNVQLSW